MIPEERVLEPTDPGTKRTLALLAYGTPCRFSHLGVASVRCSPPLLTSHFSLLTGSLINQLNAQMQSELY